MPEESAAAQAAPAETKAAEPAAQAALPAEVTAAMQQLGASDLKEMVEWATLYKYAETPEGRQRVIDNVKRLAGVQIAKEMIAADPDAVLKDVDREVRRKVRRSVARRDQDGTPVDDDGVDDAPNPAEEAKAAAREARDIALAAQQETRTAARAVAIAPQLAALATKDPRIAQNFPTFSSEVSALLQSGHPKYQGQNGVIAASEDVLNRWEAYGTMAGLKRPAAAAPAASADVPIPTAADAAKIVQEALAESRGRGVSGAIDAIMKRAGLSKE